MDSVSAYFIAILIVLLLLLAFGFLLDIFFGNGRPEQSFIHIHFVAKIEDETKKGHNKP